MGGGNNGRLVSLMNRLVSYSSFWRGVSGSPPVGLLGWLL